MKYRQRFRVGQLAEICAGGFIGSLLYPNRSLLTGLKCATVAGLVWCLFYFFWYWDIRDTCVVQRRFLFRQTVFPFSDIIYVGPMKGAAAQFEYFNKHIQIETAQGRRMLADPADPEAFLGNMRRHLPRVTLNL